MKRAQPTRQKGQITIVVGLLMFVLLGMIGLAIDGGLSYVVKAKLNSAVDSAAVAAARAVTNGATQGDQIASAQAAATAFFNANFPSGYLMATPSLNPISVSFDTPKAGAITIGVSASADKPLNFMKVLGYNDVLVASTSQTIRRDLDLIFVIDSSGSMGPVWSTVKSNANSFLDQFSPSTDRVGLVHFSSGAVSDIPINTSQRGFNRTTMESTISGLGNGGNTNYAEGLYQARQQLDSITTSNQSSLRVVVFFSDGEPNTLAANYQMGTTTTTVTATRTTTCTGGGGGGGGSGGTGGAGGTAGNGNGNGNGGNGNGTTGGNGGGTQTCTTTPTTTTTATSVTPNGTSCAGGAMEGSATSTPNGLYYPNRQDTPMTGTCNITANTSVTGGLGNGTQAGTFTRTTTTTGYGPVAMTATYDVRQETNPTLMFQVIGSEANTHSGLPVTAAFWNSPSLFNAATNVPMEMASYLRSKGVFIFTLGLDGNGGFDPDLLKNMANTPDATQYNANQTSGMYCYAKTINDLKPCFTQLASAILRISK